MYGQVTGYIRRLHIALHIYIGAHHKLPVEHFVIPGPGVDGRPPVRSKVQVQEVVLEIPGSDPAVHNRRPSLIVIDPDLLQFYSPVIESDLFLRERKGASQHSHGRFKVVGHQVPPDQGLIKGTVDLELAFDRPAAVPEAAERQPFHAFKRQRRNAQVKIEVIAAFRSYIIIPVQLHVITVTIHGKGGMIGIFIFRFRYEINIAKRRTEYLQAGNGSIPFNEGYGRIKIHLDISVQHTIGRQGIGIQYLGDRSQPEVINIHCQRAVEFIPDGVDTNALVLLADKEVLDKKALASQRDPVVLIHLPQVVIYHQAPEQAEMRQAVLIPEIFIDRKAQHEPVIGT